MRSQVGNCQPDLEGSTAASLFILNEYNNKIDIVDPIIAPLNDTVALVLKSGDHAKIRYIAKIRGTAVRNRMV